MREGIQGLGWFIRRTADPVALGQFYHEALGLPVLRQWDTPGRAGFMMHAGGHTVFEILRGGQPPPGDPMQAACTPVFRARGLEHAFKRAERAGARMVAEEGAGAGRTLFFCDPVGHVCGLRESDPSLPPLPAPLDEPVEGERAEAPPPPPAIGPMPEYLEGLGWVRLRVEDPAGLAHFYRIAFGFEILGKPAYAGTRLRLGDGAVLELLPGGASRKPPKDRVEVNNTWVLRVYDYLGLKAHMAVEGVRKINTLEFPGGWLDYYVDPEGRLFGFHERKPPDPDVAETNQPEDIAARRRWEAR